MTSTDLVYQPYTTFNPDLRRLYLRNAYEVLPTRRTQPWATGVPR